MNFDKIKTAKLPSLPKDLEEDEISKAFKALEKAHTSFTSKVAAFLGEVTTIKEKVDALTTAASKAIKNRSKDPKKAKAAEEFLPKLSTYKESITGK